MKNHLGFTLMEILVSMGIGLVVLAAVTTSFITQSHVYNVQEQVNEMQQNARGALDIITRDVKMAGYKPNGGTVNGIVTATSGQLRVQADLDASGTITSSSDEDINYMFDSVNLLVTRNSVAFANRIENLAFAYYKADGVTQTSTIADMRKIKITVRARTKNPDPQYSDNGGYRTYEVSAFVTPANLAL